MLTKDRLNARVRDQRLILEAMSESVDGAKDLAARMLRAAHENAGQTYATLAQAWLAVGEGGRLFPFFREAMTSSLVFAPLRSDPVAMREQYVAAAQDIRSRRPFPSYEDFRQAMANRFSKSFEAIEAELYSDLEDFRMIESCPLQTPADVFAAYHARQLSLLGDHASKVLLSTSGKGRRFANGEEMVAGDGKKLLSELTRVMTTWTLSLTVEFSGKERTCLVSSAEFPIWTSPHTPGRLADAWAPPTECDR